MTVRDVGEWAPGYRRESWVRGLEQVGVRDSELADELDRAFRGGLGRHCVPYDDVLPVLGQLSPSYALAVATNGPADVQATKLQGSGLQPFFPVVVASSDVGFGKPDARIFTAAVERIGIPAADVLVVGDSLEKDVAGAAAANLPCVWVNRARAARATDSVPDFEIGSLAALPSILRRERR